ncbi:MAG: replicative DNA helicase, partial [Bacillaceae bacterium]|nr:replicative DNA helicase [Bacillaceae bacterium]
YKGQRVQEVTEISQELKMLAKVLGVPVIVLSQLTREVDKREDKRPLLSDLRDSGSIEQDADKVIFLYRDSYYHQAYPDKKDDPTAEAIVAKNRNGSTGTAKLLFFKEKSRFENMYGKQ